MNARYARVSPISPPISDMKNPHPMRSRYPIFRTLLISAGNNFNIGHVGNFGPDLINTKLVHTTICIDVIGFATGQGF